MAENSRFPFMFHRKKRADEWDRTIIAVSPYVLKDMSLSSVSGEDVSEPATVKEQHFKIRLAHSDERVNNASLLVQRLYSRRGYDVPGLKKMPDRITLIASQDDMVVGTLTLGIDSGKGLSADENYKAEVDRLRAENRQICELTKFAVDQARGSKRVLAGLFHIAYIYARVLNERTDVVIEVTPRHAPFYRRSLGFEQIGEERLNTRVHTMGVLLWMDIAHMDRQIERFGGQAEKAKGERSLYPYFFSKADEAGITQRLLGGE